MDSLNLSKTEYEYERYGPNTESLRFWKFYDTELLVFLKMNEYQIVLFGLNYSNTEYLKLSSSPPSKFFFIFEYSDQMWWGKFDPLSSYLHEGFLLCFLYISCF